MKHLWEVEHSYYCNEGNYFDGDCNKKFKSWQDFMDEMGNADLDMNLLFRWDMIPPYKDESSENPIIWQGDENYRDCVLKLFWMGQRKGLYFSQTVEVCRSDESAIREYLTQRFEHLKLLWSPL